MYWHLDHSQRVFGGLYHSANFGCNWCNSFKNMNVWILSHAFGSKMPIRLWCAQNIHLGALFSTLPDMEVRTGTNTAQISTIYIWLGLATILGLTFIGPLFGRINGLLLLAGCFLMLALFDALSPISTNVVAYQATAAMGNAFYACCQSGMRLYAVLRHVLHIGYTENVGKDTSIPWLAICCPSGSTVASGVVVVAVGFCNGSQMRTSKCTFYFWYACWS